MSLTYRTGKHALVVFLDEDVNDQAYSMSLASGWTRQEFLARAFNHQLAKMNITHRLPTAAKRIVGMPVRKRGKRVSGPRANKIAIAGWYPTSTITAIHKDIARTGQSMQGVGEAGVLALLDLPTDATSESEHPRASETPPVQSSYAPVASVRDTTSSPASDASLSEDTFTLSQESETPPDVSGGVKWEENLNMEDDDLPDF